MWIRFEPDRLLSIEVEALDPLAAALYLRLLPRLWRDDGLPDDPDLILRSLGGWMDRAAFQAAWTQVRALFDCDKSGRVRLDWMEAEREEAIDRLKSDAERQRIKRARERARHKDVRVTPSDVRVSPGTDGETERRTDGRKKAPAAPVWDAACEEVFGLSDRELPGWMSACAERAAGRKLHKRDPTKPEGWNMILREWKPLGLAAFRDAVKASNLHNWQGLFPPKSAPGKSNDVLQDILAAESARQRETGTGIFDGIDTSNLRRPK